MQKLNNFKLYPNRFDKHLLSGSFQYWKYVWYFKKKFVSLNFNIKKKQPVFFEELIALLKL